MTSDVDELGEWLRDRSITLSVTTTNVSPRITVHVTRAGRSASASAEKLSDAIELAVLRLNKDWRPAKGVPAT